MEDLTKLKNIGPTLAQKLQGIGVESLEDLKKLGSIEVVLQIRVKDLSACYNMLYAIEGAIQGIRWHNIPPDERAQLKAGFDISTPHPGSNNMISVEKIEQLPLFHREIIPQNYIDLMGHMNVQWYMALYSRAGWEFFASIGMDEEYYRREQAGGFALKHFIRYYAEVREGETVAVRTRIIGRTEKRIHFIHFMINETSRKLASTLEALGSHADMRIRRTAPYPPELAARLDAKLEETEKLDWEAPLCGCIEL